VCGILGAATATSELPVDAVASGLGWLRHRGPEAKAHRVIRSTDTACVLGHTRLRIIDLSEQADQPLSNEDGTVWVSFNGELYDFPELRAELELAGHRFATATDTEVLVHLYEECDGDPDRMLPRLRGMFAFALFDTVRGRLLLGRDRLGIKPMYATALPGDGIAFGSEAMVLARSGLTGCAPDSDSLIGYLLWGSIQGPATALAGVREVPAGSYLLWEASGERTVRFWRPVFAPSATDDPGAYGAHRAVEALRDALEDAVPRHLVTDREVGLFLSSGVDSGAVARMAARAGAVRSLTVTFPDDGSDEGVASAKLADELGLRHEAVPVTGAEVSARLDDIALAMDQPTADGVNTWLVSRAARDVGLVVALSGVGGDELFGGYPSFHQVPQVERAAGILHLTPWVARRAAADAAAGLWPGGRATRTLTAQPGIGPAYRAVRGLFGLGDLERLGVLPWIGEHDLSRRFDPPDPPSGDQADQVAFLELTRYLHNQLLRDTDQMSMAHSLEVRVPLLDDRVVEVALATPSGVRNRPHKALLRRAVGAPGSVGPKLGFTLPFDTWMPGSLREPVREALLSEELPLGWLIGARGRAALWGAFEERRVHWSRPWAIAALRRWAAVHELRW
jgi:asparagine synthase (glutamine-hydrolysing)